MDGQGKDPHWREFHQKMFDENLLDGLEIFNNKMLHKNAIPWAVDHNLSITSSSDIHYLVGLSHYEWHLPNDLTLC